MNRIGVMVAVIGLLAAVAVAVAAVTRADSTEDYPIPRHMLHTPCTAEQILAAARDVEPVYYERYMIDYNNKSPEVQRAVQDRIHWFFGMDYAGRRAYSERTATDAFYEQLAWNWPNWAKIFFNNKGVAAGTAEVCERYQPGDLSVWEW